MGDKRCALERVLFTARKAFEGRPYDRVSITQIAAEARCSTATIYEAYGSKRDLYEFILRSKLRAATSVQPVRTPGHSALDDLLAYAVDRVRFFSETTRPFTYLQPDGLNTETIVHEAMARNDPIPAISALLRECQNAGWVREGDTDAFAYVICSSLAFEPMILRLNFQSRPGIDPEPVIGTTFRCFLTDAGMHRLQRFLEALASSPDGTRMSGPAIHDHLPQVATS